MNPNAATGQPVVAISLPVIQINREGINIGEADNMCCFIVEIKIGIIIIGCICICMALANIGLATQRWTYYNETTYSVLALVFTVPSIIGGVMFGQWFLTDTPEKRQNLPKACLL